MIIKYIFLVLLFSLCILPGCGSKDNLDNRVFEIIDDDPETNAEKVRLIFYNMYLPTEMSRLFEKTGTNYNPKILNSADNFSRYDESSKIALNIGIYGVDLSYCRLFGQNASAAKYFSTVQLLYEKIGIPDYYYEDLIKSLEKYYSDKDSLAKFASDVFERADQYLRENNSNSLAALVITGGWIEALYISCKIAESNPENIEIIERIAAQKYSLNSLISLLSNYQENIEIAKYILFLKGLKKSFDKFDIYYNYNNVQVDTIKKLISATEYEITLSPENLKEISGEVIEIRSDIIN